MEKCGEDADLTNLNWVAGTPVPINLSVSPTKTHSKPGSGNISAPAPRFSLPLPPSALVNASLGSPVANRVSQAASRGRMQPLRPAVARVPVSSNSKPLASQSQREKATHTSTCRKPLCSYTCLIAMALKSSASGCLPVNEIYKYIE